MNDDQRIEDFKKKFSSNSKTQQVNTQYQYSYVELEDVIKNPGEYIIPQCLPACKILWDKNIETFMVSNNDDDYLYVLLFNVSNENKKLLGELIKTDSRYFFDQFRGTYGFRVNGIDENSKKELAILAGKLQVQDTLRYKSSSQFLEEFKTTGGKLIIDKNGVIKRDINPDLSDFTLEEALKYTHMDQLYIEKEDRVYESIMYLKWHQRYLSSLKSNAKDDKLIEKYIQASKRMDASVRGSNKKCYVFGDVVLLKGLFTGDNNEKYKKKERKELLKQSGVNVCRTIDILIEDNIEYELQERAKGEILYYYKMAYTPEGKRKFLSVLDSLSNQDISFYKKFLEDWYKILDMGFDVDPSKCSNFFYDGKSICFIDLNLKSNSVDRSSWVLREAATVLRGGGIVFACKDIYDEADEKIRIIYQKICMAALELGLNIDDFIDYFDLDGHYGLKEIFNKSYN